MYINYCYHCHYVFQELYCFNCYYTFTTTTMTSTQFFNFNYVDDNNDGNDDGTEFSHS